MWLISAILWQEKIGGIMLRSKLRRVSLLVCIVMYAGCYWVNMADNQFRLSQSIFNECAKLIAKYYIILFLLFHIYFKYFEGNVK